jgi:acetyl-CoA carboxylase carboxyltransferase component
MPGQNYRSKITVVIRKGRGVKPAMCNKEVGCDMMLAWPTAELAVMGAEGAVNVLYKEEIQKSQNKQEARAKRFKNMLINLEALFEAASKLYIESIIEPKMTRRELMNALEILDEKEEVRPLRKHGNFPV